MGLTNIQWATFTFNGWLGCRRVAEECRFCYAETLDRNRFSKTLGGGTKEAPISHWGDGPRHRTSESNWKLPLRWNATAHRFAECGGCGFATGDWPKYGVESPEGYRCPKCGGALKAGRPRVFCASLSDWLDDENVPIEWLADLLKLIHDTPNLDWLLLTKRPQNFFPRLRAVIATMPEEWDGDDCPNWAYCVDQWANCGRWPANVWIGVSAGADQAVALSIPARVHFLSCEPMLRPLDETHAARFDWIIFGGESGKHARPCSVEWIQQGISFCRRNKIASFVKQLGAWAIEPGRAFPLRLKDSHGGDPAEWPEELRVREFPKP